MASRRFARRRKCEHPRKQLKKRESFTRVARRTSRSPVSKKRLKQSRKSPSKKTSSTGGKYSSLSRSSSRSSQSRKVTGVSPNPQAAAASVSSTSRIVEWFKRRATPSQPARRRSGPKLKQLKKSLVTRTKRTSGDDLCSSRSASSRSASRSDLSHEITREDQESKVVEENARSSLMDWFISLVRGNYHVQGGEDEFLEERIT